MSDSRRRAPRVLVLGLALLLPAFAALKARTPGPADNLITISVDPGGVPVVDKPSACGVRGQRVQWHGAFGGDTAWLIVLTGASPFVGGGTRIESNANPGAPNGGTIRTDARSGTYAYEVKVILPSGDTLGEDPDIVIKEPPGPDHASLLPFQNPSGPDCTP